MNDKSVLIVILSAVFFGCSQPAAPPPPPPTPVNVYVVKQGNAQYHNTYPATVTSVNEVEVRPQVAGYITGIFFKEGQRVEKGQKLYTIDAQQYRGAYEQAVAQLHASEANLARLKQDADRYQELIRQDAVAQQTVDHAVADYESGKKQVDAAKANVSAVEVNLRYATIYAPLSGTIGISQVKQGASVSPGSTLLNTISSNDPIAVDVALDETLIPFIQKEYKNNKLVADSIFTIILADQSKYPYPGTIYIVDRAVDPQTATIKVRLSFPNSSNLLRPGMSVNLKVLNNSGQQTILIPYRAVTEQMAEYFVFVVQADTVAIQKILIGQQIRDMVVVKSGLEVNDKIVIDGVQKLKNGSKVNVATPNKPGPDSTGKAAADSSKRKPS